MPASSNNTRSKWPLLLVRVMVYAALLGLARAVLVDLPNMMRPRFVSEGEPIHFRLQVRDGRTGAPMPEARIEFGPTCSLQHLMAETGPDGCCILTNWFPARGIWFRSGECEFYGVCRVAAAGFREWESPVVSLFGERHDYFTKGTSLDLDVRMSRAKQDNRDSRSQACPTKTEMTSCSTQPV
jgi:hypothetical protein